MFVHSTSLWLNYMAVLRNFVVVLRNFIATLRNNMSIFPPPLTCSCNILHGLPLQLRRQETLFYMGEPSACGLIMAVHQELYMVAVAYLNLPPPPFPPEQLRELKEQKKREFFHIDADDRELQRRREEVGGAQNDKHVAKETR